MEGPASATTATKWAQDGSDGLRSFSSTAGYPGAAYSTKTTAMPTFSTASTGKPWQRFGNLYSWTTATLSSGTKVTTNNQDATDSICPRGWGLPKNSGDGSFSSLFAKYGLPATGITDNATTASQVANFPINFMRTGYYYPITGGVYFQSHGDWWTATWNGNLEEAHILDLDPNRVRMQIAYSRGYGIAVRCVAR